MQARSNSVLYSDPVTDMMTGYIDHRIEGSSAGYQTDYPVFFRIYRGYGSNSGCNLYVPSSEMHQSYNDVRFVDDSGRILPYFIEKIGTNYADIAVKLYSIPTAGATIRVLWGAGNIASASTGSGVFPTLFDGFEGASLDASIWTNVGGCTVANSKVTVPKNCDFYTTTATYGYGYAFRCCGTYVIGNAPMGFTNGDNSQMVDFQSPTDASQMKFRTLLSGNNTYTDLGTGYAGADHIYDIGRVSGSAVATIDHTVVGTHTTNLPTGALYLMIWNASDGGSIVLDWVSIRKYTSPEPAHGWWGDLEEL